MDMARVSRCRWFTPLFKDVESIVWVFNPPFCATNLREILAHAQGNFGMCHGANFGRPTSGG